MECLSGVACVLWCDHALVRGRSQGVREGWERFAGGADVHRSSPHQQTGGTPISAMRLREALLVVLRARPRPCSNMWGWKRLHRLLKNPVLLKGTASAVPQVFCLQWGFSP
jgi:hypothetical protein